MKMKKRFAALALMLSLVSACAGAGAAGLHEHTDHTAFTDLGNTKGGTFDGTAYYLTADLALDSELKFTNSTTVYLCLNGNKILGADGKDAVQVTKGDLVLCDCGGKGVITHDTGTNDTRTGRGVYVKSGGMTMYGGEISGNTTSADGGGVYAKGETMIAGGRITGNSAKNGGGVYQAEGNDTLTIADGVEISNNSASENGGGVYTKGSTTIAGAAITGNSAQNGGGVYAKGGDKKLTISGAAISKNSASGAGGGVYAEGSAELTGGTIGGNTAGNTAGGSGGGMYAKGHTVLSGGEISGNTAADNGGGVYVKGGDKKLTVSGGVKVSGNKMGSAENNLYLPNKTKIKVAGTLTGSIGVTSAKAPEAGMPFVFTEALDEASMAALFSDAAAYEVGLKDAKAALYVATVYTAPTAKEGLVYSGSGQALVTAGSDNLLYALGTDDQSAPTGGWNAAIPAGLDAGEYYVWYYVPSGGGYLATKPQCVQVSIAKATPVVTDVACEQTIYEDTDVGTLVLTYTVSPSMSGELLIAQDKLTVGENICDWTFVPADTKNFETVSGKVTLAVLEAEKPDDEEPKDEDPKDEDPKDEDPKDEDPKDEEPKDEEPKDEEFEEDGPKEEEPKDEDLKDEELGDPSQEEAVADLPKTGDESDLALYAALMTICAAGYALMRRSRRAE